MHTKSKVFYQVKPTKKLDLVHQLKLQSIKILIIEEDEIELESVMDKLIRKVENLEQQNKALKLDLLNHKNGLL